MRPRSGKGPTQSGKRIFDDFRKRAEDRDGHPDIYDDKSIHRTYGLRDYARVFYNERSSVTGKQGRRIRNPLFFGDSLTSTRPRWCRHHPQEELAGVRLLITDFDRDNPHGLSEIRAYGDVR